MPLHDFRCLSGHEFERAVAYADLQLQVCACGVPAEHFFKRAPAGFVQKDICYDSPVDGRPITNKHARVEDLRRNNCIEYDPEMRTDMERKRADEERRFDASIEATIDSEIAAMPARKRELLETEARGAEVVLDRK